MTADSCFRLPEHSATLCYCQRKLRKACLISHLLQRGYLDPRMEVINSRDLPVNVFSLQTRWNINKHNHSQMSPNEMWQLYWASFISSDYVGPAFPWQHAGTAEQRWLSLNKKGNQWVYEKWMLLIVMVELVAWWDSCKCFMQDIVILCYTEH